MAWQKSCSTVWATSGTIAEGTRADAVVQVQSRVVPRLFVVPGSDFSLFCCIMVAVPSFVHCLRCFWHGEPVLLCLRLLRMGCFLSPFWLDLAAPWWLFETWRFYCFWPQCVCVIVSLLSSIVGHPVLPPASPYENYLKPSIFATYPCMVWTVPAFCSCPSVLPCKSPSHSALLGSRFLLFLLIGFSMMATVSVPKSFLLSIDSVLFSSLPIRIWPSYIFISTESFFF